jgi:hypothetical protein
MADVSVPPPKKRSAHKLVPTAPFFFAGVMTTTDRVPTFAYEELHKRVNNPQDFGSMEYKFNTFLVVLDARMRMKDVKSPILSSFLASSVMAAVTTLQKVESHARDQQITDELTAKAKAKDKWLKEHFKKER